MMSLIRALTADGYKKFSTFVIVILAIVFREDLSLADDQVEQLTMIAMAYLVGQGLADFGKGKAAVEKRLGNE